MRLAAVLTFLLFSLPSLAADLMFKNEYRSKFEGFSVSTTRTLTALDDGTYLFRVESSNFLAKLDERSHFRITEEGLFQPIEHRATRKVLGIRREERTLFNWETGEATYTRRNDTRIIEIEPGYTDQTLYQYLMELDLQKGVEQPSYQVIDKGRLREFTFERLGEEQLDVDGKDMLALKLRRVTEDDSRETLVWFVPEMDYRLVQIIHSEKDGSEYEMYFEN